MAEKATKELKNSKQTKSAVRELKKLQEELNEVTAYLSDFLAFLPLAVCDLSPNGMVGNVNKAFEELTGFGTTEAVGQYLPDFFLEKTQVDNLLKLTQKESIVKDKELTLVSKAERKTPVSVSFSAKRDNQGNLTGYFVSIIDVSALKKLYGEMEERIRARTKDLEESRRALLNILEDTEAAKLQVEEEKSKTQSILNNFIDGLLIFSPDKNLELMNPKAEEFLDIKQEEILSKSMTELEATPQTKPLIKILKKKTKKVFRKELVLEKKQLVLEITTQTISSGKKGAFTLVILHDITREKLIEKLKSQFVSVAAHQLRTPLSIIKWSLSMILAGEMGDLGKQQKEMLSRANQTNERMIRLINDLLNVARIEEGRFVYQPKTVDLSELVERVVRPLKSLVEEKRVKLEMKVEKGEIAKVVKVDIEKMSLAVKNLVENAIFYTNPGGNIVISLKKKGGRVEFSIKDNGIGIPKDQHERVFSKFFRGDNAVRMETEGTGLGLFITKNIIEAHGGKIWFESRENKGTTFSFSLPAIG